MGGQDQGRAGSSMRGHREDGESQAFQSWILFLQTPWPFSAKLGYFYPVQTPIRAQSPLLWVGGMQFWPFSEPWVLLVQPLRS